MLRMHILRKVGNTDPGAFQFLVGRTGASQDPLSRSKHLLRMRTYTRHRAGMVWADDGQKPAGSISSAWGGFEEGERAWREASDNCFRRQQYSRTQHLSLALFLCCSCQVLIGKDSVGHCDKEATEVIGLVSLVSLLATGLQAAPRNGTGFFTFLYHLVQPLFARSSFHRLSDFLIRMTRKNGFHKALLCACNCVHKKWD